VEGIIVLRNEVIPIVDLRRRLYPLLAERSEQPLVLITHSSAGVIGLKVDEVLRIVTIARDQLLPPPPLVKGIRGELLIAVIPHGDEVLLLIDMEAVLTEDEKRELAVADRFIYGTPKRISREAPVLILRQYRDDTLLGGAGNAINNILSLGGLPIPISVLGHDPAGEALLETMTAQGIDCGGVLRTERYQTPTKVRILGGMPHASRQQIVRYDIEDRFEMTAGEADTFGNVLREQIAFCNAALISDYGYGVVKAALADNLTRFAHGKPVTLDSRHD